MSTRPDEPSVSDPAGEREVGGSEAHEDGAEPGAPGSPCCPVDSGPVDSGPVNSGPINSGPTGAQASQPPPPTVFTRIIKGEIPARFVFSDDVCVAFMDVRPLNRGHVLVVPRVEIDHWTDLDADVAAHLMRVAQRVGRAQQDAGIAPGRVGLMIAGFEVPHVHVHVVPVETMAHLDFAQADAQPDPDDLDALAARIRPLVHVAARGPSRCRPERSV